MHKPDYTPTLTAREFWTVWNYGSCSTEVWCFVRDLMQLFGTDDPERTSYTEAILRLLKAADLRKLRLVWIYASHLIR